MTTPPAFHGADRCLLGALAPLSRPGWVEAGRQLLAGMELAVREVNAAGGIDGVPLELVVRDTAGSPDTAVAAVDELERLGVVALVGEYHSAVARAVVARAEGLGLPFLCSSAVIDALADGPVYGTARLPPPQSRGWRVYADCLLGAGHRRIAVASEPSVYWAAGARILREHLAASGGGLVELDARMLTPAAVCDALVERGATALLLLVGMPEPAASLVRAVRRDSRLAGVLIGAPAGQPEFAAWWDLLGEEGASIPFLRYLPDRLPPSGVRIEAALRDALGVAPSFVAFEGYDAVTVLATSLRQHGPDRARIAGGWPDVTVEGSRGVIRFVRSPGTCVWQWPSAPVQVVERDPVQPDRFHVFRSPR